MVIFLKQKVHFAYTLALYYIILSLQFNIPQPPRLRSGSYVGWTYADNVSPISFDFRDQYRSYYSTLNAGAPGPKVGDTLNFEPISFPAVFSIAATINTSKYHIQ